ncbi:GTP-dependent dephospho-CoA kinase family protein [Haloarchaeobius sp. HRN-SO-5]|uniref:GTP-dependent dephospho-CoA kinase family protein n=1 Tax=Haloarchaeobius sp. HRN-SO-5 TaxID=3446118 RepID=UPI003EBC1D7C
MSEDAHDGTVLLTLPTELRSAFKEPLGPVETDADVLLASVTGPLVTVGDIVTYHLVEAGRQPDVALVDERTKRAPVDEAVRDAVVNPDLTVSNPAGTVTEELVVAIRDSLADGTATTIFVEGEEDLATLPAVLLAPDGASVVYGQPGEGMVHVRVTPESRARMRALVERMDGDVDRALSFC